MKLAFMGTPEFAVPFLQALHCAGHELAAVYTQPPRPRGRGLSELASPVSQAAQALGLPVYSPKTLRDAAEQARFQALAVDAAIIVAYGLLLPEAVLNAPRLGCYNAHASLLPRWRGAAPVQRAIAAGDTETGLVIMRMDKGLDTGPILCAQAAAGGRRAPARPFMIKMPIGADMTAGELFSALAAKGAELTVQAVAALADGQTGLQAQAAEGVTYAHKITKEETRINWHQPAEQVHKHICSLSPFPGAWCEMILAGKRERVKILASHCADKAIDAAARQQGLIKPAAANSRAAALEAEKAARVKAQTAGTNQVQAAKTVPYLAVQCAKGAVLLTQLQKAGGKVLAAGDFLRGAIIESIH
ncbi:methionyl-tRNA formyltransferase [Candidatus Tokpelaia sp.]|uniref:methionyl-tRNA formyltransferase n=1 Tax=Candidatus Tokpelaia sp. TaxID=2233777 RepID=UPI001239626D|nr:methionyl-tRNA formyltransferase [Candidatus Tokpelaia sp.]KAA6406336.1 methionyl-tRNA formyltransferase [Candidatus Tokpelaia sp.]